MGRNLSGSLFQMGEAADWVVERFANFKEVTGGRWSVTGIKGRTWQVELSGYIIGLYKIVYVTDDGRRIGRIGVSAGKC